MGKKQISQKIGKNSIIYSCEEIQSKNTDLIWTSWETEKFIFTKDDGQDHKGFRIPQLGALYAIKSHWTVSSDAATIVMPTGTGKTEVMIATIVSEVCRKTLIIVPSDMLRTQTSAKICTLGKLAEIGAITQSFLTPHVGVLTHSPENAEEFELFVRESNVIVTTMSLLNSRGFKSEYLDLLANKCDTLMIDEAHHLAADTWKRIKTRLARLRCLQFTATPFRNDGQKVDGRILYNFPLLLAQEQGYFKPINFYPVWEFDNRKKDLTIANKAVELLQRDIEQGFPHVLLVRTSTKLRATALFTDIYQRLYSDLSPVLIISGNSSENKQSIQMVKDGLSKIVVCVDMFSEGIDIPQLKICAIHDKYKSLPVTIQFIGRFARSQPNLGDASIIANIADDDIQESLEQLYSQDADWNKILRRKSEEKISTEIDLQEMAKGFTGTETIPITQIKPKISMFMYKTVDTAWHWKNWAKIFDPEHCHYYVNESEKILVITELVDKTVDWSSCKDITDQCWNLHILYWNQEKGVFFIHSTEKGIADRFARAIFSSSNRVVGERVFRCFADIKRLMLSTVGLKTAVSSHYVRFRMYAGVDIATGLTKPNIQTSIKSNVFGIGYENGVPISIGCSYKGTVWARQVNTIDFWKKWCDLQASKILNPSLNTDFILQGALTTKEIKERPHLMPYRIDFPDEFYTASKSSTMLSTSAYESPLCFADIELTDPSESGAITFKVKAEQFEEQFSFEVSDGDYAFTHVGGARIILGQKRRSNGGYLLDYFKENPPRIWFVNGSSLIGNLLISLNNDNQMVFPSSKIQRWDWTGVTITSESQGLSKKADSIQYRVISRLKATGDYTLIFDDDGSGEVADVVAVKEDTENHRLKFELYHCKYSHEKQPGSRVNDLYEVCGQAEKCIKWFTDVKSTLNRLIEREQSRVEKSQPSRFEIGDNYTLYRMKNELTLYKPTFDVFIVQPGVDGNAINDGMHQVLSSSESFLSDTFGASLTLICS